MLKVVSQFINLLFHQLLCKPYLVIPSLLDLTKESLNYTPGFNKKSLCESFYVISPTAMPAISKETKLTWPNEKIT